MFDFWGESYYYSSIIAKNMPLLSDIFNELISLINQAACLIPSSGLLVFLRQDAVAHPLKFQVAHTSGGAAMNVLPRDNSCILCNMPASVATINELISFRSVYFSNCVVDPI
jgi:hypothetical protein